MLDALNNWRLTRKMLLSFAPICLVIIALGAAAVISSKRISAAEQQHINSALPALGAAAKIMGYLREYRIIMYSHMNALSATETGELEQRAAANHDGLGRELTGLAAIPDLTIDAEVAALKKELAGLEEVNGRILALSRQNRNRETLSLLKSEGRDASRAALTSGDTLMATVIRHARDDGAEARVFASRTFYLMLALILAATGCLAVVWRLLNKTVADPMTELATVTTVLAEGGDATVPHRARGDELGEIAKAVEQFRIAAIARQAADRKAAEDQSIVTTALGNSLAAVAQGDLTAGVSAEFPAEMATLKTHFNDALTHLRGMVGSVSESASGIRTGSNEIAQAAEDLARRTESNAASLEETSAALVQIDDRLKTTAKAAGRTVGRADQAIATVGTGRAVADEAVRAMERVRESATGIDSVIEGLDKIAFQTRVLAMNAAIEAGRAGDAGRGFAVVADLVSSLAMRSEEEAKRARDQLTVTQTDVVTAVEAVQKVDSALANISGDVGEVHTLLGSMAADNQAQSSAITQISAAISSMDQSTQQNAAMVEQTSAAARNLTSEITSLAEQAALFKIDEAGKPAAPKKIKVASPPQSYVSPVKPLPVPAMTVAASDHVNGAGDSDWSDF